MAKGSGNTRLSSHKSSVDALKNSDNWDIKLGMNQYDVLKDKNWYNFSNLSNLNEEQKTYMVAYLTHSYGVVNKELRSGKELGKDMKIMVKGIDEAMKRIDEYKGIVYRGLEFRTKSDFNKTIEYYKNKVGETIEEKGYTSAGINKRKIESRFGSINGILFTIESKTGKNLTKFNDTEQEVLFKRSTKFKVISVKGNRIKLKEI